MAVGALAALGDDHAGVVHQRVELAHLAGQPAHGVEVGEVGHQAVGGAGISDHRLDLGRIAPVDQHRRPALRQLGRDLPAEAVGRAGHEDALLGQRPQSPRLLM